MADKRSGASTGSKGSKSSKVDVPYGNPYTPEKQTEMTRDKVRAGITEVMGLVRRGAEACVERAAVLEHATKLERQSDKIAEAIDKDAVYVEEVRHHHNRISDLCDNTRNYTHDQMVADLKRAAAIRTNVMTIIQGKPPEFEMEQDELDDLKSVRLMLRRKFGVRKVKKEAQALKATTDETRMLGGQADVKADNPSANMASEIVDEEDFSKMMRSSGWAADMLQDQSKPTRRGFGDDE